LLSTEIRGTEVVGHVRAMATDVTMQVCRGDEALDALEDLVAVALRVFRTVEQACTRFDPQSPLMRANARPTEAHRLPHVCFEALREAARAYRLTDGRFDPRVLGDLLELGYDRSLPFADGDLHLDDRSAPRRPPLPEWTPQFRAETKEVVLGPLPVDLGGIGKGLAVRWASEVLRLRAPDHLVEGGGDCYCSGRAPGGGPWLVAVEDPFGGQSPRAVLELRDQACATSSIRLRNWCVGGRPVHHLVDPDSGQPGGAGLRAVTVVAPDPATAEVWAKALFLAGAADIQAAAGDQAALWIDDTDTVTVTAAMARLVCWGPQ